MTIPVSVTCGICRKPESVDMVKVKQAINLGYHICAACRATTGIKEAVHASVVLPAVRH